VQTTGLHESFYSVTNSSRSIARGNFLWQKMPSVEDSCFFCSFWNFEYSGVLDHNFGSRHARRSIKGSI